MVSTVGFSTLPELAEAASEAGRAVQRSRPRPAVALLLATHSYPLDQLAGAASALRELFGPGVRVAAVTVNGLLYRDVRYDAMLGQQKAAAVVALGRADVPGERVSAALVSDPRPNPRAAGRALAERARAELGADLESALLFSPGLPREEAPVEADLLDGVCDLEPAIGVSGTGLSGGVDLQGFCDPGFALLDDRVERDGALLLAFEARGAGQGRRTALSIANGMRAIDAPPVGVVTQAEGGRLIAIDGRPAFERVSDAVRRHSRGREVAPGDLEKNLSLSLVERCISLAVEDPAGGLYWPRVPMRPLPDGSILVAFEARPGEVLRLVQTDEDLCLAAAGEAASRLREGLGPDGSAPFELALAFSCSIRGFVLGARSVDEGRQLVTQAPCDGSNALGVVANGEFGTYRSGRPRATGWAYSLFGVVGTR
jgi:FIST-like protein